MDFIYHSNASLYIFEWRRNLFTAYSTGVFFFYNDAKKVSVAIILWSIVLLINALLEYSTGMAGDSLYVHLAYANEFLMATSVPFILAYNGERGGSGKKWEKNLFYIFYPLHLAIIYIIRGIYFV